MNLQELRKTKAGNIDLCDDILIAIAAKAEQHGVNLEMVHYVGSSHYVIGNPEEGQVIYANNVTTYMGTFTAPTAEETQERIIALEQALQAMIGLGMDAHRYSKQLGKHQATDEAAARINNARKALGRSAIF